ncbi:flavin reductase family protein [Mycobacterium sp. NAZ190054]|uniref:flavin reductase family protein n=1 Tax=Mycobacterium sp. NAZ190054 TaxID=1747766 RepID=UPI0009EB0E4B|nr:flavin reductase family protein [Mycobacterium sp. NAZ190054]
MSDTAADTAQEQIKAFHRKFATGVTVVTTMAHGRPRGLAVNAFTSVTVSPAVILVCVARSSSTHDALFGATRFAVNLLAHDQVDVAARFATKSEDKFAGLAWHTGPHGMPVLDGACAHLEAETSTRARTSSHTVFFGEVLSAHAADSAPLIYADAQFYDGAALQPVTTGFGDLGGTSTVGDVQRVLLLGRRDGV